MHAHFDCFSGISGDMTLAAMVDLGVPPEWLREKLELILPADEFELKTGWVMRSGIKAVAVDVKVKPADHARDFRAIKALLLGSVLPETVRQRSLAIFEKIAAAEAAVHGCSMEQVHFHEVGAVDAIVDIVGTALGLDYLGVASVSAGAIPLGCGFVVCQHGTLPVPAPATLKIVEGLPVCGTRIPHELTTPTGAAILAVLADEFGPIPLMTVRTSGYGAGKRELKEQPNLLRVLLGRRSGLKGASNAVVVIETTIDDMNPEIFGFVMERLFQDGALDVCWVPVQMKKNRPGTLVQVLSRLEDRPAIVRRLLSETTTSGVRYYEVRREILEREIKWVDTAFGKVQVKAITRPDGKVQMTPEFDACRDIARERNMPIKDVYERIIKEIS